MAAFKFRFAGVLKQRRLIEDERQRDLAKHMRRQMILQNQLKQMQQTISESKHALGDTLTGKVDLDRVGQFARYSGQVSHRAQQIVVELHRLQQEINEARGRLIEATQARKAIELLHDRELRAWKKEQKRKEAIELDEIATDRFIRQDATRLAS